MPNIRNAIVITIAALLLAGCATTRPTYLPPTSGPTATIKGGNANVIKFFSDGASHVAIIEIDGLYLSPSFWTGNVRSVKVPPGLRKITVLLSGNNYTQAQDTIEIDTFADRSYQIEARKVGISFDVVVYEEGDSTTTDRKMVLSTRMKGGSSGGPAYIPIFIPMK
jgi:hypothetical protein